VNIQLKQRLVGAIVLVSLGVIFIPMILPGNNESQDIKGSNIPPAPDYQFTPPPEPPKPPVIEKAAPIVEEAVPQTPKEKPKPKPKSKSKSKSVDESIDALIRKAIPPSVAPSSSREEASSSKTDMKQVANAWVVQVGSFSSRKNALALRDKIREQGHASFVEEIKGEKGMIYRVRVGPELTRDLAEDLKAKLQKQLKLKGLVLKYP
jgi:DedD protein